MVDAAPVFCPDDALAYDRSRTVFVPGQGLALDEAYRLAHLPLVAPDHPGVIPAREGRYYSRGRHPRVVSLVLRVPQACLAAAPAHAALERDLRAAPFAHKIAWDVAARRADRLHATLCGSLAVGPEAVPELTPARQAAWRPSVRSRSSCAACSRATSLSAGSTCGSIPNAAPESTCWRRSSGSWAGRRAGSTSSACTP